MITSTSPRSSRRKVTACSLAVRKREIMSTLTEKARIRREKVWKCWSARMVVGTSTAT